MEFRILGSLEVWEGERQVELGGPKRRAVLAFLLLHANEVVAADRLVDRLWGEKAPHNAVGALQTHVSRLRKELGPEVVARGGWGYVLRAEPGELDLDTFERLTADAESLPARERAAKLREALALWRGSPLEDVALASGLAVEIARLEELHLAVLENRIDADLEAGNDDCGLVGELEELVAEHPLRERLRGQLILTLYRGGRQAEALEVYRETRRVLADELGLEPSPELRELERAILQQDAALRPGPGRPAVALPRARPGRRSILVGASLALALLLAGVGTAASYALTVHTTHATRPPTTVITLVSNNIRQGVGSLRPSGVIPRTTVPVKQTGPKTPTPKTHRKTKPLPSEKPTATLPRVTAGHAHSSQKSTTDGKTRQRKVTVRIHDSFNRSTLASPFWEWGTFGTGPTYTLANGQLSLELPGNLTFDQQYQYAGIGIQSKCFFPGAFDARIDYRLDQWPGANGASLRFFAQTSATVEEIARSAQGSDYYGAWPNDNGTGSTAPTTDQSGTLRLTRSHGVIRAAYLQNGHWTVLGRKAFSAPVDLEVALSSGPSVWQQQDVSAFVDNFRLTAPKEVCYPDSNPQS